ncbi:MAG: ribonuclease P protein component [Flavobacteriales bacterium]|nr:MAG: ribonuclease P protein component [Flavobacteriales bacterium]
MPLTFPKKEKLKSKKLIDRLFAEGKAMTSYPIKLIYIQTGATEKVRFQTGVTVPKKKFKSAVKRNRIKRLLREAYRLNKPILFNNSEGNFAFLFLYLGKEMPQYQSIEAHLKKLLQKFINQVDDEKLD